MQILNAEITGYRITVRWTWGKSSRFQEKTEWTTSDLDEQRIKDSISAHVHHMAQRYCFDCGRIDYPMHPSVDCIEIRPISACVQEYSEDWLQNHILRDYESEKEKNRP